jgi:hypothetical protein
MPVIRTPRGKYKKYLNDPTLVVPKSTQYHCKIDPHKTEARCRKQLELSLNQNNVDNLKMACKKIYYSSFSLP